MASPPRRDPADRRQMDRAADIRVSIGATGSGKTHQLRLVIRTWRDRVLAWDWKDEFVELPQARSISDLATRAKRQPRLRYVPDMLKNIDQQFEMFCRVAWHVQAADPGTCMLLVVEEASEVCRSNYAPPWWSRILTQGRVWGFTPYVLGQRPTQMDKSTIGNATWLRCGRLTYKPDAQSMGEVVNVPRERIMKLEDRQAFEFDGRKTTFYDGKKYVAMSGA